MAFDLASATPVADSGNSGGFDLSTAQPVEGAPAGGDFPTKKRTWIREEPSIADRVGTGLRDTIEGPAQLLTHVLPEPVLEAGNEFNNWLRSKGVPLAELPTRNLQGLVTGETDLTLDKYEHEREKTIQAERGDNAGVDWARLAGNIPGALLLPGGGARTATTLGAIGKGAGAGALGGALQPVTQGDFWTGKTEQAAAGAAGGAALPVLAGAAGRAVEPWNLRDAAMTLLGENVRLTPGQMAGSLARRAEEAAKSVPILGSMIRSGERRAVQDFNRATIEQALRPIGGRLPDGATGNDAINEGQRLLGEAYDRVLPHVQFGFDAPFAAELTAIRNTAREMPRDFHEAFETFLQNRLAHRANPTGLMDGEALKQVQSEFSNQARKYASSSDAAQRDLGATYSAVNDAIRAAVRRQNPAYADALNNIDRAYAAFTTVERAAARRATGNGTFSATDLLQAIKSGDTSVRKRAFAAGNARMQGWAQAAHDVLGNKMPDSGTAERAMWDMGGLGAMLMKPPILAAVGGASTPYTGAGMSLLRNFAVGAPATRNAISQGIQGVAQQALPYAAPVAGAAAQPLLTLQQMAAQQGVGP